MHRILHSGPFPERISYVVIVDQDALAVEVPAEPGADSEACRSAAMAIADTAADGGADVRVFHIRKRRKLGHWTSQAELIYRADPQSRRSWQRSGMGRDKRRPTPPPSGRA